MTSSTAPRYAGLDGLRAVAVLLVVAYHLFPAGILHSGFVGVDVFFVISGFLITSLLRRELTASGRIALRAFWARRARRLLPALLLVVTASASAALLVGGDVLVSLGRQALGAATFSYNWLAVSAGASYFSGGEPELLRNLWSLAVEEQFYLLWPLLLPLVLLLPGPRAGLAVGLAMASGAWAVAVVGGALGGGLTRAYYGTDTHAFGLLIGVALALAVPSVPVDVAAGPRAGGWRTGVGIAALVGIVAVAAVPGGAAAYPYIPFAASLLTAAVIAAAVAPGSALGSRLDIAPLRWIGARSYGIYLWHWPVVVLLTIAATGSFADTAVPVAVGVAASLVTVALAALSYRMLEQPVRTLGFGGAWRALTARLHSTPPRRLGAVAALSASLLVVGGTAAAIGAAPPVTSSQAAVEAGQRALDAATTGVPDPKASQAGATTGAGAASAPAEGDATGSVGAPGPADGARTVLLSPTPATAVVDAESRTAESTPPSDCASGPWAGRAARPAPACADPHLRPQPPATVPVDGSRISAIGDSVMLASSGGLLARFPGIQIDAAVSRSMWAGDDIVSALAAAGALRDYVVVGLGTNGPVSAEALQSIYDIVGPSRTLVLVNAFAPRDWIDGVNRDLAAFAAAHPGVVVADWAQAIGGHTDLLAGDGIHPGEAGGAVFAEAVAGAVDGAENQRAQARYRIELIRWATAPALAPR
ncbi:acyltransferase family protein [Microbacterium sp.]|uniref:acyltransferase family protein n=1 Tax=Microbacterium sp. TaxID=51671 RepID=UPI0039E2E078